MIESSTCKKILASIFLLLAIGVLNGQETYDIKSPGSEVRKKCGDYLSIYEKLPVEVRYSVSVEGGLIYFYFPSKNYYNLLFDNKNDGIAVDIVKRSQYRCYEKNNFSKSPVSKGYLMPPMYLSEMTEKAQHRDGYVYVPYGELPPQFDINDVECNLLVIQKKFLCSYHAFSNFDFSNWDVLEMGLYKDSLSRSDLKEVENTISKSLRFTIPFEKNRSEFDIKDIQPLYDSLHLTDYNIKRINIRAYTSVEGSTEKNIQLQEKRAASLVSALQQFQKPEISSTVIAKENWVEFLNDLRGTSYEHLLSLSKEEIKHELATNGLGNSIEHLLAPHRKGLIELDLQKKFTEEENNPALLKKYFDQNIVDQNINEAIYIQNIILEKIREEQLPEEFLEEITVPNESLYGPLLNNFSIFNSERNSAFVYENIRDFESLLEILPNNKKILYNITALKIRAWREGDFATNEKEIKELIDRLRTLKIEKNLRDRLWVNYNMILSQYKYRAGEYKKKNLALNNVWSTYRQIRLSDQDLLSLAKYLSWYSRFDWAEKTLSQRITEVDVDEDLIFYYLKLTISDPRSTRQSEYRTFMLNAVDKNNQRFCDLFLPKARGGYTFQLLDDEYLRKTYCENCDYSSFQ